MVVDTCQSMLFSEGDLKIDASSLVFVDPLGIAMLGSTLHMIQQRDKRSVEVSGAITTAVEYLQRMDGFPGVVFINQKSSHQRRHDRSNSLVELTMLSNPSSVEGTSSRLARALLGFFREGELTTCLKM